MPAARKADPDVWMPKFLAALGQGLPIALAAKTAGIDPSTTYYYRTRDPQFAARWQSARAWRATPARAACAGATLPSRSPGWRIAFLDTLVETSNVTAAAARAGVPLRTVYKLRRDDAGFAAKWRAALFEGYDNLEMELLGYLRDPQPARKMDVASALRLLVAHRQTVERERALREEDDEQAVLESIDRFIDEMRVRRAANGAILIEMGGGDDDAE
jgi:hypothetical protein